MLDRPPLVLLASESNALGGVEEVMIQIAEHAPAGRFRFAAFFPDAPALDPFAARWQALGATVLRAPLATRHDRRFFAGFVRCVRSLRPDLVHFQLNHVYSCEHLVAPARALGVRALFTTDNIEPDGRATFEPARRLLKRVNLQLLHRAFVVSPELERFLRDDVHAPPGRVERTGNGVDTRRPSPPAAHVADARRELGAEPDDELVVSIARLHPQKGLHHLIEAAALVHRERPRARFAVVGDGDLHGELEARAAQLGLGGVFRFAGRRSDLAAVLGAADVFVLPSLYEGLPLVLLEAMAAGRAVVATRVGGVPTAVRDGESGLLVPPADPPALAAALVWALGDRVLRERLGQAARAAAERDFDVRAVVARITAAYDAALDR